MKSYILTIALAMLVAALYAFQNPGEVVVTFLFFNRSVPLGVWDTLVFSAGAVLMWLASLGALFESSSKYKTQIKEKDKRIADLEEEKKAILAAMSGGKDISMMRAAEDVSDTDMQNTDLHP